MRQNLANYRAVLWGLAFWVVLAGHVTAQRPGGLGRGPGQGQAGMLGGVMGSAIELLQREDVRKELELLDDQLQELTELGGRLRENMRERLQEVFGGMRDLPREERGDAVRKAADKLQSEVREELTQVLLPHQMKRLDQLSLQRRLQGSGAGVLSGRVAEELGISDAQREQIRNKAQEVERDLREQMAELRRKAQQELLSTLTPQQQAKFREMIGEPFDFQNSPGRSERQPDAER